MSAQTVCAPAWLMALVVAAAAGAPIWRVAAKLIDGRRDQSRRRHD